MNISNLVAMWEVGGHPVSCRGERLVVWELCSTTLLRVENEIGSSSFHFSTLAWSMLHSSRSSRYCSLSGTACPYATDHLMLHCR